ncbi:hypothetical protein T484DRAFT_1782180, partial [Baffinella frigidus]
AVLLRASYFGAVALRPSYFEAYASLGGALTPSRQWHRAAGILEGALKLNSSSPEGLYLLAFALSNIKTDTYEALKLNPSSPEGLYLLAFALSNIAA